MNAGHRKAAKTANSHSTVASVFPKRIHRVILGCIIFLAIADLARIYLAFRFGPDLFPGFEMLYSRFALDRELSLGTWFSVLLLLATAGAAALIAHGAARKGLPHPRLWMCLAFLLLALAIDEGCAFHEIASEPLRPLLFPGDRYFDSPAAPFQLKNLFYNTWVIPAALFTIAAGLAFLKLMLSLPSRIRNLTMGAAALYVGAAIGGDLASGAWYAGHRVWRDWPLELIGTAEETSEMLALSILLLAFLERLRDMDYEVTLRFTPGG